MSCDGIPEQYGPQAAVEITNEFAVHRPWQKNVTCVYDSGRLILTAESEVDSEGLALNDEFSDCLCAYLPILENSNMKIESVTKINPTT
jgi:hypothetical protein